jgi:hypothetical protein
MDPFSAPADASVVRVTLSGVRSVTHLVYAASYVRHLLDHTHVPVEVGVLDSGAGRVGTAVTPTLVRESLPVDERLEVTTGVGADHFDVVRGRYRVLLSIGAPGVRAWTRMVRAGRGRRPHVVVVDEGIGSYGNAATRRAAYQREGGRTWWPWVRAGVVATGHRVLTDVHWSLYRETHGAWVVVPEVADEFRRRVPHVTDLPGPGPAGAVYLSQPWPELGIMSASAYVEHLQSVREACAQAGLHLSVRPHPAEDAARYAAFDVAPTAGPAELDPAVVGAAVVIGSNSTALLNLAAVHGVRAVRVTAPDFAGLEAALAPRQRSLLDTFLAPAVSVDRLGERLGERLA